MLLQALSILSTFVIGIEPNSHYAIRTLLVITFNFSQNIDHLMEDSLI
nr:MAG TPA: hypothetical protein [Caudoviricetes sp.]